ncbi:MAG: hypothetical protein ACK4YF_07195 [Exilispira sp.]
MKRFLFKNISYNLIFSVFFILMFFAININIYGQNITLGFGFGYTDLFIKANTDLDAFNLTYNPAIGYEIFTYFSLKLFNNFDLILGLRLISKGFTYTSYQKFEIIYLQSYIKLRYLIFITHNSRTFFDLGFDLIGNNIYNCIFNYSNFSISYNNNIIISINDNSLNLSTGIIYKNIIFSLNIYLQLNQVFNIEGLDFSNYSMIFEIGFII